MIVLGSAFRNSAGSVGTYMRRAEKLAQLVGGLTVIAVEGDSKDATQEALRMSARKRHLPLRLVECNHGGPVFGSVETEERFVALSKVGNAIFDAVAPTDSLLLYVESDLDWEPAAMAELLRRAATQYGGFDVHAPLVKAGQCFYDVWGFRDLEGHRFGPMKPFHHALSDRPMEISSAGSCLAMRAEVARAVRIRNNYCLVGWCEDARNQGFRIAVHPDLAVRQV